jgi:ribosome-associated protein
VPRGSTPVQPQNFHKTGLARRLRSSPRRGRNGRLKLVHHFSARNQGSHAIAEASRTLEVRQQRSKQLALAAARTAEDNRGQDVVVLDMRGMTTEFDYFVLVTGNSRRQLHAISEEIDRVLEKDLSDHRMGIEGYNESRWILLDYGTVVIHMFDAETRSYYALEDLWGQAARVPLPWQDAGQAG